MAQTRQIANLINALRASRDQLRQALADRDAAWLALARIATAKRLEADDLRRMALGACPRDPWDLRIEWELRPQAANQESAE